MSQPQQMLDNEETILTVLATQKINEKTITMVWILNNAKRHYGLTYDSHNEFRTRRTHSNSWTMQLHSQHLLHIPTRVINFNSKVAITCQTIFSSKKNYEMRRVRSVCVVQQVSLVTTIVFSFYLYIWEQGEWASRLGSFTSVLKKSTSCFVFDG